MGVLYIFGLLIINIDLARYQVVNLDLARPEYVVAGLLWVLVIGPASVIWLVCLHSARDRARRREFGLSVLFTISGLVLAIPFPAAVLAAVSGQSGATFSNHVLTLTVNLGALSVVAIWFGGPLASAISAPQADRSVRLLSGAVLVLGATLVFLLLLVSYATFSFPYLPKMIGGGRKPFVEVMLSGDAPKQWDALNVPISPDRMTIGPVVLLFEAQHVLVITQRPARAWPIPPERRLNAVAIERGRVVAVTYKNAPPASMIDAP